MGQVGQEGVSMRDLWLICEKCCCEEPCLIYIEGGGQMCERQEKPCVLHSKDKIEFTWWRPLTEKDIEEFEMELKGMDEYLVGVR